VTGVTADQPKRLSGIAITLLCIVGAAIAWKPADLYYTESRARHIGDGYLASTKDPNISKDKLREMAQQTIFERRMFVGIVTAIWGAAVCGLLGASLGLSRRSAMWAVVGLLLGAVIGAITGIVAGFSGQFIAETRPIFRFDADVVQLLKTMGYHALIFAVLGLGVGITFAVQARFVGAISAVFISMLAGLGAALVFTPIVSVVFPLADTTYVVPPGSAARLLWFLIPAGFIGAALSLADRPLRPVPRQAERSLIAD
jgi:hypothetical protein